MGNHVMYNKVFHDVPARQITKALHNLLGRVNAKKYGKHRRGTLVVTHIDATLGRATRLFKVVVTFQTIRHDLLSRKDNCRLYGTYDFQKVFRKLNGTNK